jgi:hypothetical protein
MFFKKKKRRKEKKRKNFHLPLTNDKKTFELVKMDETTISTEFLATSIIRKLNRRNIFPPLFNNPEFYLPPVEFQTKKPLNSFLICRRNVHEESRRFGTYNMRVISKVTSILWKSATSEERYIYKQLADFVCELHFMRNSPFELTLLPEEVEPMTVSPFFPTLPSSFDFDPMENHCYENTTSQLNTGFDFNENYQFITNHPDEYY